MKRGTQSRLKTSKDLRYFRRSPVGRGNIERAERTRLSQRSDITIGVGHTLNSLAEREINSSSRSPRIRIHAFSKNASEALTPQNIDEIR